MLPRRTIKNIKKVCTAICGCGAVPFLSCEKSEDDTFLTSVSSSSPRMAPVKIVFTASLCHTIFLMVRLVLAYSSKSVKFFILYVHFSWCMAFFMISWLHITLYLSRFGVKAYFNGLIKFFGSFMAMPGARYSAKERRRTKKNPTLIDILVVTFIVGAVMNVFISMQVFLMFTESHQYLYSTLPRCWKESSTLLIIPFLIYEAAIVAVNWTLMLFFIIIHLVHLFCTRDYLLMLRKNTRNGILKLSELLHQYRSMQILQNHYNESVATFMPPELFVVLALTLAGNIGTIRMVHLNGNVTTPEMALLPMISLLTIAFQMIFYSRAGDLHHISFYFKRSSKKGLFGDSKLAKMYLNSFPPLCVKAGSLLSIRKFTVVKFVSGVVVGTARLSVLFFSRKYYNHAQIS